MDFFPLFIRMMKHFWVTYVSEFFSFPLEYCTVLGHFSYGMMDLSIEIMHIFGRF